MVQKTNKPTPRPALTSNEVKWDDSRPTTLKDIAKICGLAVPTVSRALSGASDISLKTRQRVRGVADQIGYIPNRAGVRLRTGKTNVVSLLLPADVGDLNLYSSIIGSIATGLHDANYHLNVTPFLPNEDPMKPVKYVVENRLADAVIMNQIKPEDERVAYLLERSFPFATHGRTQWCDRHPYFDFDNYSYSCQAVHTLATRNRRSILLLAPPISQTYSQDMILGLTETGEKLQLGFRYIEQPGSEANSAALTDLIVETLHDVPEIDGIIASSIISALAASAAIEQIHGVAAVGDRVDIITKETQPFFARFQPKILTISEHVSQAGGFLARAALQAIKDPTEPPMQMLVSSKQQGVQGI